MFSTYFFVSALALAADWLCLVALTSIFHVDAGVAAVGGYLIGGLLNYALSRRFVFKSVVTGARQFREAVLFLASCLFGALLTGAIVHVSVSMLGSFLAKALAVGVSMATLYWVRRLVVFRARSLNFPCADRNP